MRASLQTLWEWQIGPVEALEDDLHAASDLLFDPARTEATVRHALTSLPPPPEVTAMPQAPYTMVTGTYTLITLEGRVALEVLRSPTTAAESVKLLLAHERNLVRHRVRKTGELLAGGSRPLQAPALGLLVVLQLLDRFGPASALPRGDNDRVGPVDGPVFSAALAFAGLVAPSHRPRLSGEHLRGGWTLHELTRRLPTIIPDGPSLYLAAGSQDSALEATARFALGRKRLTLSKLDEGVAAAAACLVAHTGDLRKATIRPPSKRGAVRFRERLRSRAEELLRDGQVRARH
jgi:hypothetical protein